MCYWTGELVLYNYGTRVATRATPLAIELLDFFGSARSIAQTQRHFSRFPPAQLSRAIRLLERRSLIAPIEGSRRRAALDGWGAWSPIASLFHFATKDVAFLPEEAPGGGIAVSPPPPAVKRYRRAKRVALPAAPHDGELPSVLLARRTWRRFSRRAVTLASVAALLGLTFRLRRRAPIPGGPRMVLRSSPSPGARHALEAYVLVRRVEGLPRGLYHYAADRHQLERLTSTATRKQLLSYLPTQYWYGDAAALVLITAVFPRVWWRYDYPRAYRAVLIEAGHFCQTFLLTATWLGLAPFCSMALADSRIERDLGIDGVTESVLYAAGVGVRPPGVDWAPTPAPKRGRMSR